MERTFIVILLLILFLLLSQLLFQHSYRLQSLSRTLFRPNANMKYCRVYRLPPDSRSNLSYIPAFYLKEAYFQSLHTILLHYHLQSTLHGNRNLFR